LKTAERETHMNPKDALREEHGETMKMLLVLQRFSKKLVDSREVEAKDLEALIEFFEIYVDRCHHGKEEQHLFPALSRARSAEIDSLISSLVDDHRQARLDMEQMKFDAGTLHSCTAADRKAFSEGAEHYVELVRKHIRKENSALLPLIEAKLSETDRLQLAEQFHELERATLGSSRLQTFLAGVRELSQKYSLEKI
jgi:hemerythrin-like domain-containing protein